MMEYTEEYLAGIDEALADQEFTETLTSAQSKEQLQELFFKCKNIKLEDAVAEIAFEKFTQIKNGEELSPEDLELVAGGCVGCKVYALTGMATGAAIGAIGGPMGVAVGAVIGFSVGLAVGRTKFHRR